MKKGDLVFYKQRVHEILMLDGPYLLIRDVRNRSAKWVKQDLVMSLEKRVNDKLRESS